MSAKDLRPIPHPDLSIELASEAATISLAEDLAAVLQPGDLICLSGDLGAGKSTLARALLRALADDPDLEVPSPTFTLVQTYELARFAVSHFDLYRLEYPEELDELGLDELLETGAALVEWPELGGELLPSNRVWLRLDGEEEEGRKAMFRFEDTDFGARLERSREIRKFLNDASWSNCERRHLKGDASARSYERVGKDGRTAILMNSPALYSEQELGAELSYSQIVHLAQDVKPFVAIGSELHRRDYGAPEIYASETGQGLLLIEDLGDEGVLADGRPHPGRYEAATEVLARMHGESWPREILLGDGSTYQIPDFSRAAMLAEADLFLDWYVPEMTGTAAPEELRQEFHRLWSAALDSIAGAQKGWVLRDYHSPNLLWRAERQGLDRLALIDFQDAVIGPVAYDVASLLLDARVEVPEDLEAALLETYVEARRQQNLEFDEVAFKAAYAVMAAQRVTKILGIFVRLARRDLKPVYLAHLPRMNAYLDRALDHPVLSDLKLWYDRNRP
ncbi:tRNA (adenosine(37)-N6)-threonylcarbamoyltransferase complex ATPase subunit type 1 TsaE [Roseibium polysiphoniae]|uniref:tRNA (adenosine(37)-N6)-threonylcarbamoyltransferase complex ATPase subunit type 1 TsaE n=1 Tax=Roseibium polysiphoniae TaxID=2571221 RepID=UPI0032973447